MCPPPQGGLKDRRAVRLVAAARHGQDCALSASAKSLTPNADFHAGGTNPDVMGGGILGREDLVEQLRPGDLPRWCVGACGLRSAPAHRVRRSRHHRDPDERCEYRIFRAEAPLAQSGASQPDHRNPGARTAWLLPGSPAVIAFTSRSEPCAEPVAWKSALTVVG